jgi:ribosome-binding factor A
LSRRSERSPSQRQLRVGEEVRHALAWMLERGDVRDPGLAGTTLTVTEVRMSPDLRQATAYVVPLGGGGGEAALAALARAAPYLRRGVAERVRLKFAPGISFRLDSSFDEGQRIERLLREASRDAGRDGGESLRRVDAKDVHGPKA